VLVGYPSPTEEFVIVERMIGALLTAQRVMTSDHLIALQNATRAVYVDPALIEYSVFVANATRQPAAVGLGDMARLITYGASPRASINMILAAQALALVRGRQYALPEDVYAVARDVLRHRLVLSYEALGDNVTPDDILNRILSAIPLPEVVLRETSRVPTDNSPWLPPTR
jgi:MoxR-like ATPase